jgi:hypothetical protein
MCLSDPSGDWQAKASTARAGVKSHEPLKNSLALVGRNTRAIVSDAESDASGRASDCCFDSSPRLRVPDRILQEIGHHLSQEAVVANEGHGRIAARLHIDGALAGEQAKRSSAFRDEVVEIQGLATERDSLRLGARQEKHGVDEPCQPRRLLRDDGQGFPVIVLGSRLTREHDLCGRADHRHRSSQFVRRVRHELPLRVKHRRQAIEETIERGSELAHFVVAVRCLQARRRISLGDRCRLQRHVRQGAQRLTTDDPPAKDSNAERHHDAHGEGR